MNTIDQAIDHLLNSAGKKKINVEVLATEKKSTGISMQSRSLEQFSFSETRQVGVRVIDGLHEGVAYSESIDPASLDSMLDEAISNSKVIKKDFASELRSAQSLAPMEFIFNPALEEVTPEAKVTAAGEMEAAALEFDSRITNVPYSRYRDIWIKNTIANSKGFRSDYQANSCSAIVMCLAKDGDAAVSAGEMVVTREFDKLGGLNLAATAAKKTLSRLGARRPPTGRYTVVFENRIAEELISMLSGYFSAKSIDENTSPLKGKLGQKIFSPHFTLIDDPAHSHGMASRPFDDEGFSGKKTVLVDQGQIANFLTNSVLAGKMKLPHTAHAARSPSSDLDISPSNLIVNPGTMSFESLLGADKKVILITSILGTAGFRRASGDFSIPVEGHMYEDGKPVTALKDFLISGNILQMFNSIDAVGNDVLLPVGSAICPSLLVRDLNVAGQS